MRFIPRKAQDASNDAQNQTCAETCANVPVNQNFFTQ
jgi:hypothetical protein